MLKSRLTKKYQATIPEEVRKALALTQGEEILFVLKEGEAVIRKLLPLDVAYIEAVTSTLGEWASAEDEQAYANL